MTSWPVARQRVSGKMSNVPRLMTTRIATSAGSSRLPSRVSRLTGLIAGQSPACSFCALTMTCRSSEPTKKYPDRVRNTSTPPDTRPNQMWKHATKTMARPRRPSRSVR